MEYTIVNGASAIARGATKYFAKNAKKINILDTKVFRQGVYKLQEELEGTEIEKTQTPSAKSLEYALEDSETVIYFTHDYLSMTFGKGNILEATAKAAKSSGVKKLIWVCPIEHDMYYTEDGQSPIDIKNKGEELALSANPSIVFLHSNLAFGDYSYLIRYITQSVIAGKIDRSLANPADQVKYFPIHFEDLANAITHAISNYDSIKGSHFTVKGKDSIKLPELKALIEKHIEGKKVNFTNNFGIGNFLGEFFRGIGHDQNMSLMADFFRTNFWEFTHEKDYHTIHKLDHKHSIHNFFDSQKLTEENYVYPLFSGYKNSELD